MTPNTSSMTVSSAPKLNKQQLFAGYKKGCNWYSRNANRIRWECFCGLSFSTEQARNRHLQNCHEPKDAA
jgi:hypothetical protein